MALTLRARAREGGEVMGNLCIAARSGNRRKTLEELRDQLAYQIERTESGRDMAALTKRLMEVISELDGLPDESAAPDELDDALDDLA